MPARQDDIVLVVDLLPARVVEKLKRRVQRNEGSLVPLKLRHKASRVAWIFRELTRVVDRVGQLLIPGDCGEVREFQSGREIPPIEMLVRLGPPEGPGPRDTGAPCLAAEDRAQRRFL